MNFIKVASKDEVTDEMEKHYIKRTDMHVKYVREFLKKIYDLDNEKWADMLERAKVHDDSKYVEPEFTPYIFTTWRYKCKDDNKEFSCSKDMEDRMLEATLHHVKNNSHHPEYHSDVKDPINKEDRDKPAKLIDATAMPDLDIAEMVADWSAMGKERGNTAHSWAKSNVGVRWDFTDEQSDLIFELIDAIE